MSHFDMAALERLWISEGGSSSKATLMAAIATAESSGDSTARSWAGALGLWQVMPFWASDFGWSVSALLIATYSARAAIRISGDGNHVGAWDTCYNPPSSAAHRLDLSWPQRGSPAYNILGGGSTGGGGGGGHVVQGNSYNQPSSTERAVAIKVSWANHLQEHATPDNIAWLADQRRLRK